MTRAAIGIVLVVATLPVGPARAEDAPSPVTVKAVVTPASTTIGTRVRYEVTVGAPPGVEVVVAQPAERIGDMDIVDFGTEPPVKTPDGRVVFVRWWQLVAWSPGEHHLSSPEVRYRQAGGELATPPAADVDVTVASLLERAKDQANIRDIKPPDPIPVDWRPYYALAGVLVALAAVATLVYRLRTRPRRAAPAPPPLPPHVIALRALESLRARSLVEHGAFKEFYSALSDIVRRYLEERFSVRAPEMTTEEFLLLTSRDGRLAPPHRRLLGEFLTESDLVKFARHLPTRVDSQRAFDAARRFVDDTTERPEAA